jgi:hypothetical protein
VNTLANSAAFWLALIGGLVALYVLPSVIAACRKVDGLGWVIVLNLLPSGVGWVAALVMAFMLPRREPQPPAPRYYY